MTTLDEAKGTVDKTSGHGKKDPASPFSVGQRVAHYKGMGKTIHGNVVTPHAVSGGTKGAMVKFAHGTEFVPHKDLKDAGQYWKDEQDAMYKKRSVKEETELSEMKALPRRHFFDSHGLEKHGVAYTDNKNWWKIVDGKPVAHTADHEVVKSWKRELNAMTKQVKEETELEESKDVKIAKLRKDYADKMRWSEEEKRTTGRDRSGHLQGALKIKAHLNKQYGVDVKEDVELEEGSSGTIIHKVTHEGKVKFITKYGKAAEAVAKKIEANTGIPAKITQHIADKNGFYRLHKEDVDYIDEAAEPSSDIEHLRTQAANHEKRGEWEWSQGNHSGANTYYQKANELRARVKSMSVKKVQENADDRWVEYSHDSETGYTCHHIPRYLAKPGEMRFKHTLDGRSELSHSKHYPESMKDEILRKKSKNEGVSSDWEEEREEKRKKLAGAMAAVDHLSKNMSLPTGRNYPAWLKRKQDAAKKMRDSKPVTEETLNENTIPVQHVTDAVHKVLGAQATVKFLTHLKPGADIHTSWDKVNSALTNQGIKPQHIAKIATHLRPANYK